MIRVIIESPYAGDVEGNLRYLRRCIKHSLLQGEAPFASHALYTQCGILNDDIQSERNLGISAGFSWRGVADKTVVYTDLGITNGMIAGIADSISRGVPVVYRYIDRAGIYDHSCLAEYASKSALSLIMEKNK